MTVVVKVEEREAEVRAVAAAVVETVAEAMVATVAVARRARRPTGWRQPRGRSLR